MTLTTGITFDGRQEFSLIVGAKLMKTYNSSLFFNEG